MRQEAAVISEQLTQADIDNYYRLGKLCANLCRITDTIPQEELNEFHRLQNVATVLKNAKMLGHKLTAIQFKLLKARKAVSSYRTVVSKVNPWATTKRTTQHDNTDIRHGDR